MSDRTHFVGDSCPGGHAAVAHRLGLVEPAGSEIHYAIRRKDGAPMGDFTFWMTESLADWTPAEVDEAFEPTEYEMLKLEVTVLETRTYPRCSQCIRPAKFWGLCEPHAREDDPEAFDS